MVYYEDQCCQKLACSIICGAVLPEPGVVDHMRISVAGSSRGQSYVEQCLARRGMILSFIKDYTKIKGYS